MKKFILNLFAILFICVNFGCVIYNLPASKYSVTFSNESRLYVTDWYLKSSNGDNLVKKIDELYPVPLGAKRDIKNVPIGFYTIYFSVKLNPGYDDYYKSNDEIYVNCDKTYRFYGFNNYVKDDSDDYLIRKAFGDAENKFYLEDEQGNVIEFVKISEAAND